MLGVCVLLFAGLLGSSEAHDARRVGNPAPTSLAVESSHVEAGSRDFGAESPWVMAGATESSPLRVNLVPSNTTSERVESVEERAVAELDADAPVSAWFEARTRSGNGFAHVLLDLEPQAEPEPDRPIEGPAFSGHQTQGFSDHMGCSCRAFGHGGPDSGSLLALLALATARARDGVARQGASA